MKATEWFDQQMLLGFPELERGSIFVSMYHGNWLSRMIAKMQKVSNGGIPDWSHTGVYIGMGHIAEATHPRGGIRSMRRYLGSGHSFAIYSVPDLILMQKIALASEAARLSNRPYDYWKLFRHFIDNLAERFVFATMKQKGFRPLGALLKLDKDEDEKNICSELVERSVFYAADQQIFAGVEVGNARPLDVWSWLRENGARATLFTSRGEVVVESPV